MPSTTRVVSCAIFGVGVLAAAFLSLSFLGPIGRFLLSHMDTPSALRFLRVVAASVTGVSIVAWLGRRRIVAGLGWLAADYRRVAEMPAYRVAAPDPGPLSHCLTACILLMGVLLALLAGLDAESYFDIISEDGLVEDASAVLWFLAAGALLLALVRDRRPLRNTWLAHLALFFFFVFCGGEEISWGQRILDYESPELMTSLNKQNEFNLHDIGSISLYANVFLLGTIAFFLVLPYLLRRLSGMAQYLVRCGAPAVHPRIARIFLIGLAIWVLVGLRFGTLGFHPYSLWGYYNQLDDEIFELFAAFSFFAFGSLSLASAIRLK